MFISRELKKQNMIAYLLYMWQVEDTIRAYGCDADRLREEYVPQFKQYSDEQRKELAQWLADLTEMMRSEGKLEKGHLQINQNVILMLTDLHNQLLHSPRQPYYTAAYYKALPFIVELRSRGGGQDKPELENCFDALYGVTLLRMQQKEISADTQKAVSEITHLLTMLSDYYQQDKEGKLEL